ncbi:MAG: hypothetical protein MSQ83_02625 [Phascolarctobacterium sp.]|nr:hypothetical protein [Phascolarctobacterium sp.]
MYKSWTKRFARKIWKSPLALAVTAGILAGAGFMPSAFAAEKADGTLSFNSAITGTQADTAEYAQPYGYTEYQQMGGVLSSTYIFNWDKSDLVGVVSLPGIHLDSQYKITDVTVKNDAVLKISKGIRAYLHDTLSVSAKNTDITANDTEGIFADGSVITVNGDVTVNASGTKGKGLVAYLDSIKGVPGQSSGTYSDASLTINGIANVNSSGHAVQASGADINITGLANIHSTDGIAIRALAYRAWTSDTTNEQFSKEKMATVNIVGGEIVANKYDAIHNQGSNVYLNNEGTNTLTVKGNVVMLDRNGHVANTIMKLTDDQSSWTGGLFTTNYNAAYTIDQANNMQLTLQNGGTWNNVGESFNTVEGDEALSLFDYTSTIRSLTGGTSSATAGVIFQNTSRDLTINNYSGYTKVFYAHENDGTTFSDYTGGDVIVNSAAKGSQIDIITDNHGINLNNTYQVNTVLNNLAQKLVYSGAIVAYDEKTGEALKAEDNLFGKAVIAEDLTNSAKYITSNPISFNTETGRGYLGEYVSQLRTEFSTPLTGVIEDDTVYSDAYVLQETGDYKFTKDSSINVSGENAKAIDLKEKATILAGGTTLSLNVTDSSGLAAGFNNSAVDSTAMRVDKLNIAVSGTGSAAGINQTNGDTTIDGNVDIVVNTTSKNSTEKAIGIYANKGSVVINGDVNTIVNSNGIGFEHYGASGIYATSIGGDEALGSDITVNGKVTFSGNGNGLFSNIAGSTISVDSADITVNKDNTLGYAALRAEDGVVNVNVTKDEAGNTVAASNDVKIKGNVVLANGAIYAGDTNGLNSAINLALTNGSSSLQGIVQNQYGLDGVTSTGVKFTGEANIWLQNGATWTNEEYGMVKAPSKYYPSVDYNGSLVSNFVGGDSIYTAGNIFQNDSNPLTIGNYSGITKIYYAHTDDGTARENYAAGDTIVNHAARGSQIYMLTDNGNITVEDRNQVNKVLNALAGKLVYAGYVTGEDKLQGMVGIAEGLTTYSNIKLVKGITFNKEDGRGSYGNAEGAAGTFNSAITGTARDEEYLVAGVTRDYSDYKFDPLDYEGKTITILSGDEPGIMFRSGHDVFIDAPMLDLKVDGGIVATRDEKNPWTGSYLNIYTTNDEGASGKVVINKASGNAIESTADVRIYGQADITSRGNGIVAGIAGTNSGSVEITKGTSINAQGYGILADGGSVTLDSSNNNIVAADNAIHAVGHEVTYTDENQVDHTFKADGYVYVEGGHIESTEGKAVYSDNGKIYINVGGDHTTNIKGDVVATNGSQVNIKLTDADSSWVGRLDNVAAAEGIAASNVEMTMKNGALWTNGAGAMHINSFTGSETLKDAAYVVRNAGDLTIDYLNGAVNFIYAHEGDGDYAGSGDTIVKTAEAGSTVKLITNKNDKFDINELNTYKDVLNALASKLVYSEYASGARNLNGYLAIAEGLTSSSAELDVRSITFSNTDGRGSYVEVYEDGITGSDEGSRFDKNNVITTEDGKVIYTFGAHNGVNMVIPSLKVQAVDSPLNVVVNSVETLDFKEKVYVSADNNITINGNVNINNGWVNAIESAGGNVILNNDLKIYSGGKGLTADTVVKTTAQEQLDRTGTIETNGAVDIVTHGVAVLANGGTININKGGKFDTRYGDYPDAMTVTSDAIVAMEKVVTPYGDASEAKVYQGVVDIQGDASHRINIQSNGNALYSEGGIINVNTDGAASYVEMSGFLAGHASETGVAPEFNVVLNNEASRWEGRIRVDEKAKVNLTVQNGATWATYRYYQDDKTTPELYLNNRVSKFVGGDSAENSGIIRMSDYVDLNLENYSGNTIIHYSHLQGYDGSEKWHYENGVQKGDVIVGHAEPDSVITVMTEKDDINMGDAAIVNKVLNTLASFLVYQGYVEGERNLTGKVAIAEGLTSETFFAALPNAKEMSFDEATGRGYYEGILPGVFNTAITGSSDATEYAERGVLPYNEVTERYDWSQYNFKQAYNDLVVVPSISLSGDATVNSDYAMQIDGGINVGWERNLTVNASKVSMDTDKAAAIVANGGNININGAVDITGTGNGLESNYAQNDLNSRPSNLTITDDVDINTKGIAVAANGGYITINGAVNLESDDNAIVAKAVHKGFNSGTGGATIKGGVITSNEGYAIYNEGSQVTINNGSDTTTVVNGNIYQKYSDVGSIKAPVTNLKLTDADSEWNGSLETSGSNTFNLTLQNGAIWTDAIVESEAGNTISKFTGGISSETEGRINRNDTRDLTINNYSGFTSIFYEHGTDYTQFAAGNTIINNADTGSQITLITQRAGIALDSEDTVKAALNALAGKLYYKGYIDGQDNLSGKLMIAEDLTGASSAIDIKDVEFNPNNGQGTFGQGPFIPEHQTDTAFTTAITGNREKDYVYAGVAKEDADNAAQYVFQKDSTITTTGAAINTSKNVNIDASGKALNVVVANNSIIQGVKNNGGTLDIKAKELNVNLNATPTSNTSNSIAGVQVKRDSDSDSAVTNITGNVNVVAKSTAGSKNVIYGLHANNKGSALNIVGNVTMKGEDGSWGIDNGDSGYGMSDHMNKGTVGIFGEKGTILVNGNVDLKVNGNGVMAAWENGSRVDITGGGSIVVNKDIDQNVSGVTKGNYALITAGGGHITMNYADGKAGNQKVTIDGNIGMTWPNKWTSEANSIILAMTTADSVWNGVMHNSYYGTSRANEAEGTLYLQNGATWINEQWGPIVSAKGGLTGAYTGSTWENFIGGASDKQAGFIYQKDAKDINLVNYSGWTNVYYDHTKAEDGTISFAAGNTVITSASEKSGINMVTNGADVNDDNRNDVLNSLANKLYYLNYASNPENLKAKVGIAEGLTTSENFTLIRDISFIEATGQGYFGTGGSSEGEHFEDVGAIVPTTGEDDTDSRLLTTNIRITETDNEAIKVNKTSMSINAAELVIEANVTTDGSNNVMQVYTDNYYPSADVNITAKELNLNLNAGSDSSAVSIGGYSHVNINGDVNITANTSEGKALNGIYLYKVEDVPVVTVNGNVTMRKGNDYGITNNNTQVTGTGTNYGVTGILVSDYYSYYKTQASMTVNGDVDLLIDGTAVVARNGGVVNLNGGGSIQVREDSAEGVYNYALETYQAPSSNKYSNTINFNANAAEDKKVIIKGNVGLFGKGSITIGLATADSSWTGVMHDVNGTNKVTLKNGATWNNEKWGKTYDKAGAFAGSVIDTFVGGSNAETAGNIYQNDSNNLTLSNYSGWTNVYYAHEDADPTTMIGGDTVIGSAADNSGVTMITKNNGVTDANVEAVLNALARKLVYSVNNGKLSGKVMIAEGLTSGATSSGVITFDSNGRGSYSTSSANLMSASLFSAPLMTASLASSIMTVEEGTEEGTGTPEAPETPVAPVEITTPIVAEGTEVGVTDKVNIQITADSEVKNAITVTGTDSAPGNVAILGDAFISAETGDLDNRVIHGNAVYAEGSMVALNPETGKELVIKGDVVLKDKATAEGSEVAAGSSAIIVLDTANSSWQGNLYNDDASSAAVTLQNGAIWNNRDNNREDTLGISGHRVSRFTGGTSAETAGNFFQNNKEDITFNEYSGYTKIFFGHTNDGSEAEHYTAGNVIINKAAAGSNISMITNRSFNIDIEDEAQVNKILNSLAGKLIYTGYANGERNLTAQVQIAESLTGSSAILTSGDMNFYATTGQGYYGKQVHVAGIYTTDITGSNADTEFANAGVTEDFKSYNFKDSIEGASKVILQGIKVAGDTGNYKDSKDVTISITADQAELNDSVAVGYRGTVALNANSVTIQGVENTAIDNYGGTLTVSGNVTISGVETGIHTNSKTDVQYNASTGISTSKDYIGTVAIQGAANVSASGTALATKGGVISVGAGSVITSTEGDAIVAAGQTLINAQLGYINKEVAGEVSVAGGTITAAKGNAISVSGGHVYINQGTTNDTVIKGNILVDKDNTAVKADTENAPQNSIVDVTLNTADSAWNGSLSVAEGQVMNLTLANGATWTDSISDASGNTITKLTGGTKDAAGNIFRRDKRDLTIGQYSGWTNIYYEHDKEVVTNMLGGKTIIKSAAEGSGVNLVTDSYGLNTQDKTQVVAVLNALAGKLFYLGEAVEDTPAENEVAPVMLLAAEGREGSVYNLNATATLAEGLTTSETTFAVGKINFEAQNNGQGSVTIDDVTIGGEPVVPPTPVDPDKPGTDDPKPVDPEKPTPGQTETTDTKLADIQVGGEPVAMRAVKSSMAAASMMWRSENNDLMKRMGDLRVLEGERGLWAKYYTGKQEMDAQNANFSEKYKAYQIGYDTKVNENWTVGAALSYNDGTSSTRNVSDTSGSWSSGHGEQKNVSLGLYGSWKAKDGQYADIIMKASRLNNEYSLKFNNVIGTYNIDGDYKTWGTSISAEYGKRFEGDKGTYFEPSAELTYGHMAGKSYSANTSYYGARMNVDQDSFDTLIGRLGIRVGQKLEKGSYFAKLALAHEFMGDYDTRYNVDGADHNSTHLDFGDTWYELQIGGTAKLSANSMLYADFQRSFGGDVTEKWRVDAGLRFTF